MKSNSTLQHQDWHDRWETGRIGFHRPNYHPSLVTHWPFLSLPEGASIFVPLCGKSLDLLWLAEQGHTVIGNEISEIAAKDFFIENNIQYSVSQSRKFQKYQGGPFTILMGDFFDITEADIPNVTAAYDRAALIALPPKTRQRYVEHLKHILDSQAQLLLITLAYDQASMNGPPFSITTDEVQDKFGKWCDISSLKTSAPEDFRGTHANETVYRMKVK